MGSGSSQGANAAYDAAKAAIDSPLLDNISINGAKGVLVHFHIHPDYPILQISEAMEIIEEHADEDASVIFGTTTSSELEIDQVKITIVATGFEEADAAASNPQAEKVKQAETLLGSQGANTAAPNPYHTLSGGRRVVGGDYTTDEDILDVPTFLRKQMD
jgi:cell division protein FtsZ